MTHYEQIHKSKIEYDLEARYRSELEELAALSFGEMRHMREVVFPFSAVLMFYLYPMMKMAGEVFRVEYPMRYVIMYPVLVNREFDSFSAIFGKGVLFATAFSDGTALISTNFPSKEIIRPENKIHRYAPKEAMSIKKAWDYHQARIIDLEKKSRMTVSDFSIEQFERLAHRNDTALLFNR